jgi:GNAT superfamily N-acetyltransferase
MSDELNTHNPRPLLILSKIIVEKKSRNQGLGRKVMYELIEYADDNKMRVELSPAADFGGTSVARLKKFYKLFGFVENKGRNKDFRTSYTMYRNPK